MERARARKSATNVFEELGFPPEEAASLRIRADLMIKLTQILERRRLTQKDAARLMGVTQPRVSDLVRGKIDLFSVDTLIDMISRTGATVRVTVTSPRQAA